MREYAVCREFSGNYSGNNFRFVLVSDSKEITVMIATHRATRLDDYWRGSNGSQVPVMSKSPIQHPSPGQGQKVWQTLRTNYKVSDFIAWQRDESLMLNPNFQRRSVWKPGAKSYLIDTIIRGLPIPIIFLRELATDIRTFKPKREVVDGQQRIRTLVSFILPECLKDLQPRDVFKIKSTHNKEHGDKAFKDLSTSVQQQILDYQFSVHTFPSDTADPEILQIFARMNSTGMKLNSQELRNAEFFGEFKTLALNLSSEQLNHWRDWKVFTPDDLARMSEVELTSDIMSMMLKGITSKNDRNISSVYKEYDDDFPEGIHVARRFQQVFETISDELASEAATLYSKRTLFYALFVAVYDLQYGLKSPLKTVKPKPLTEFSIKWIRQAGQNLKASQVPIKVLEAINRRTTNIGERRTLVDYIVGRG